MLMHRPSSQYGLPSRPSVSIRGNLKSHLPFNLRRDVLVPLTAILLISKMRLTLLVKIDDQLTGGNLVCISDI